MLRRLGATSIALALVLAAVLFGVWSGPGRQAGPAAAATPVPPEVQVLQSFIDAINAGNTSAASGFFASDGFFEVVDPSTGSFGFFGAAAIQSGFSNITGVHVTLTSSSVSGSTVTGTSEIQDETSAAAGVTRALQPFVAQISNGKIASLILHYDTTDAQTNTYLAYEAAHPSNNNGPEPTDFISLTMDGNETGDAGAGTVGPGVTIAFITVSPVPGGVEQPAAIRSGTCVALGPVVQQLAPVLTNGSGSFVSMSLDSLLASPHALAVGDPQNPNVIVSCANMVRGVTRRVTTLPGTGGGSTDGGFGYTWLLAALGAFGAVGIAGSLAFRRRPR